MNLFSIRHLHWVLWIWLLLPESGGEDGLAKSEKRLVIKQESGPRGDSLVRSFVHTRVSRAFSSSSSFDDEKGGETDKPPDDRQSTIRIKNETVDLSKNTVPVLKYQGPTEPSPKEKYKRTTPSSETTPLKKSLKLKRNMTRPRPADLTTLLAFNALTPSPSSAETTRQVAESMPPTAWALASLKGPQESTRKPGPPNIKPFVSWSTRLSKPTSPTTTTEVTETSTGIGETTIEPYVSSSDITAEGVDSSMTTVLAAGDASGSSTEQPLKLSAQNDSTQINNSTSSITQKPQDITSYKPEENTISAPSLSFLKNKTLDDFIEKKDVASSAQFVSHDKASLVSEKSGILTDSFLHSLGILNTMSNEDNLELSNSTSQNSSSSQNISKIHNLTTSHDYNKLIPSTESPKQNVEIPLNNSSSVILPIQTMVLPEANVTQDSSEVLINTSETTLLNSSVSEELPSTNLQNKSDVSGFTDRDNPVVDTTTIFTSEQNLNVDNSTEPPKPLELFQNLTTKTYSSIIPNSVPDESIREVDPSINNIKEKKNDDVLPTSTVISTVNSSISMQVAPILTTPGNNLKNVIEDELKNGANNYDFAKNLPLTAETTTVSSTSHAPSSISFPVLTKDFPVLNKDTPSQAEHDNVTINQTINDIKPIDDIKQHPVMPVSESDTTSSPRSNEIKPKNISSSSGIEIKHTYMSAQDIPETTQSNYIQVNESIKPQNRTVAPQLIIEEQTTKPSDIDHKTIITTMKPTMVPTDVDTHNPFIAITSIPVTASTEIFSSTTNSTTIGTTPPVTTVLPTTTIIPPIIMTTFPPSSTVNTTTSSTTLSTTSSTTLSTTSSTTSSTTPPTTTSKSNEIKDQEGLPDMNFPPSDRNMTSFQYETSNIPKNESTPLIIQEPDDMDDEDSVYNHTDFADKKNPSDSINNGDPEDETDDVFPDVLGHPNISDTQHNVIISGTSPTPVPTTSTSKTPSTTPNIDDAMATQIDEEPPNIDEDTVYDTGVIMSVYIRIIFEATYNDLCKEKEHLRDAIVKIFKKYAERTVDKRQIMLTNLGLRDCSSFRNEMDQRHTSVNLMITDMQGQYDKTLNDLFLSLARHNQLDFKYPIAQVEKVIGQHELNMDNDSQPSGTVVAAIIISSIAAVCLFALTILLVIMRKRQSGFNYGQRCTPVSLDDYSLDNISVYNSVRRKALRASKRSYGNPAFDDPDVISNPVNFAGLANMASDRSKTEEEFSNLPQVSVKPDELPPGAELKNRYANVIPLPETRVQLRGNSPEEQFINANYIKGVKGADKFYIACQAPLPNTIEDFWQMVWDEQSRLIVMLTALSEDGMEKCADYLPPSEVLDCHRVFGDLQVTLKKREAREKYVIASLQLKNLETNLWREVTHMWYAGWPSTGVPQEPSSVIAFLIEARSYSKGAPIVVHCSPGTGRTGTVIAIDIAIRDFEAGRSVDIPKTVIQIRRGRAGAVQTKDQYHFIYKVLHLYATKLTGGGLDSI